jgi:hypothetical protein
MTIMTECWVLLSHTIVVPIFECRVAQSQSNDTLVPNGINFKLNYFSLSFLEQLFLRSLVSVDSPPPLFPSPLFLGQLFTIAAPILVI